MPPFVGRKRRSASPDSTSQPQAKRAKTTVSGTAKAPPKLKENTSRFSVESDSDSSLSEFDSDDFEDVTQTNRPTKANKAKRPLGGIKHDNYEDEDVEWEDAPAQPTAPDFSKREFKDLQVMVDKDQEPDYTFRPSTKKGPSKREKVARMHAHKMHVQFLLWHNAKRNAWINDKKVQDIVVQHLPPQIVKEIDKWKRASGLTTQVEDPKTSPKDKKRKGKKWKANGERNERDWGPPSQRLEKGKPDMSHGDPLIILLKVLAAFWKKKFAVTAPGLRKRGYGTKLGLRKDIDSYRNEKHYPAKHGEKIESLEHFRKVAELCQGSRDVGAQLFVALLRGIGLETRLVASLQPVGYGFTKAEEMVPRRIIDPESSPLSEEESDTEVKQKSKPLASSSANKKSQNKKVRPHPGRSTGGRGAPIDLDSHDDENDCNLSDNDSVIDVTPTMPKAKPAKYDRDLIFPIYWAEAISPITSKIYPVSPLVLENAVATSPEVLSTFEPRGVKADKTRQVMTYVVAYSSDYSAKDVTVRYLRKKIWPGRTKGFRVPIEKIPVYDKRGKVRGSQDYDWFKHVLGIYRRSDSHRTAADDVEDSMDLVPLQNEKKEAEGDTLQSLKTSAEFVIERHLRREEAFVPGAQPVRTFTNGKGDKQEVIPVYNREDVRKVMTAESWHKEGRAPREGEVTMKLVPVRAVTLTRKREAEEHFIRTGEKQMQGLYSQDQTDWIIPPPIQDGKIPKNSYGNIDCFVPSMVPRGAIHLPLKGTVRICKRLEIDYAEAVVGFEFGNKMAVPVILGVVIAKENERVVRDAWRTWNEEQRKKEETKMEKLVLELWRKFHVGMLIRSRIHEEYGLDLETTSHKTGATIDEPIDLDDAEAGTSGGLVPETEQNDFGGGFLMDHEDEVMQHEDLTFDHHVEPREATRNRIATENNLDVSQEYPTPVSAPTSAKKPRSKKDRVAILDSDESEISDLSNTRDVEGYDSDDQAGGFLQDDNDSHESVADPAVVGRIVRSKFSPPSLQNTSEAEVSISERQSRNDGAPRKPTTPASTKSSRKDVNRKIGQRPGSNPSTRKTLSRSAKSKIQSMDLDGDTESTSDPDLADGDNDSSEDDTTSNPDLPRAEAVQALPGHKAKSMKVTELNAKDKSAGKTNTKFKPEETRKSARRQPPKKDDEINVNVKGKRLLRKQSTLVTSPYFGQETSD